MKSKKKTLLWQINLPNQTHLSYVFGTMHIRDRAAFQHIKFIEEKIKSCTTFAVEYHLEEGQESIPSDMVYLPDQKVLADFFTKKKYRKISKSLLKSFQVDLKFFQRLQPLFLSNILSEKVLFTDQKETLDAHLWSFAKSEGKTLLGIETWQEQLNTLSQLTLEHQLKNLADIAKSPNKYRKALQKSIRDYVAGDFEKLFQVAKKSTGNKRKILLYNRNITMANRIADYVQQDTLFAGIGAGHLGGKKGVLRLLKKKGFIVKSVLMDLDSL